MARADNMRVLTEEVKRRYPGVVVYGVGDERHKLSPSDHNEDDTPGSKSAQSDKDNNPEHRGIDIMVGKAFTKTDGDKLVAEMLADPEIRARLYGIIWHGSQWWRSTGFTRQPRGHDHDDHVHLSGLASDDENTRPWFKGSGSGGIGDMFTCFCEEGQSGENVKTVQYLLWNLGYKKQMPSGVDGKWAGETTAALKQAMADFGVSGHNGKKYGSAEAIRISIMWIRQYAPKEPGPAGKDGKDGKDGRDGVLVLPDEITVVARVQQPS